MKSIKIISTRDIAGLFPHKGLFNHKTGDVIKEINAKNVTKIEADSKNITIYFKNGLHEVYHADKVKLEAQR